MWFGTDDAATSYLSPVYTNVTTVPECFAEGNGNLLTYSSTSSFWLNNRVSNACYKMYNYMAPFVRKKIDDFENEQLAKIKENDKLALELYKAAVGKENKKPAKKREGFKPEEETGKIFFKIKRSLTDYSLKTAQSQFSEWTKLEQELLVKFIDGNIKAQNPDGTFKHSEYSEGIPEGLTQPGYTAIWKKAVAESHGKTIEVKETEED